jgi:hypothetical protein
VGHFHYFVHGAKAVAVIYDVLCKLGFVVPIFVIVVVLSKLHSEWESSLANVLLLAGLSTWLNVIFLV